jgi:hypothetical protein
VEAAVGVAREVAGRIEIEGERGRHRDDKRVKDVLEVLWEEVRMDKVKCSSVTMVTSVTKDLA